MGEPSSEDRLSWRLHTFIVQPGALEHRALSLRGAEGRHASGSLRLRQGDRVRIIDGEGVEALAAVDGVAEDVVSLEVLERRTHRRESATSLTIVQALPKGRGMDAVVRRCAELGVDALVPVTTERTVVHLNGDSSRARLDRWRSVAAAATKQSRGVFLTLVREPLPLPDVGPVLSEADRTLVAWEEEAGVSLLSALTREPRPKRLVAVVGPEGGLSEREIGRLEDHGAVCVSLGRRVLRADWAAPALAAVASQALGGLLP